MLTLGIDTASKICSVALCRGKEVMAEYTINLGRTHSEGLVPQLEQLFTRTQLDKKAVELIGVSVGPGSFTGLRIGLATAEAMGYSWGVPVVGVNTLTALAYNIPLEGIVLAPILSAQKGNYYVAVYTWQSGVLKTLAEVQIVPGAELVAYVRQLAPQVVLLGETAKLKPESCGEGVSLAPESLRWPSAQSVAQLAQLQQAQQPVQASYGVEPIYIRRSEAEELWEKRHANTK